MSDRFQAARELAAVETPGLLRELLTFDGVGLQGSALVDPDILVVGAGVDAAWWTSSGSRTYASKSTTAEDPWPFFEDCPKGQTIQGAQAVKDCEDKLTQMGCLDDLVIMEKDERGRCTDVVSCECIDDVPNGPVQPPEDEVMW